MSAVPPTPANALRTLMREPARREVECQKYLQYAHPMLVPPFARVIQVVEQQVAMAGESDYFLLCEVAELQTRRRLILWEAKAPQLSAFKVATQNRLMPTDALVEAENQLLYYYDEYRSSQQFLDRYNIRHPSDVQLGGIIIGREDNFVQPKAGIDLSTEVLNQLGASALRIRNEHFYQQRLRVLTWDQIANVVDLPPAQTM